MKTLLFAAALIFAWAGCARAEDADAEKLRAWKAHVREQIMERRPPVLMIAPSDNDLAQDLVDELRFTSLAEMEAAGLKKAFVAHRPWSDTYWPIYAGGLANRYNDPGYGASVNWEVNERYLIKNLGRGPLARLSPAEKYDLLVGDGNFSLTRQMVDAGRAYFERDKKVETWMGYCHGWAPASFMVDRPSHAVTLLAADGRTQIEFYPADIRGLASVLWANGDFGTRFIGGRCDDKTPRLDHGRPASEDCIDTNPGTWHLVTVNQIGVSRRPFVLDTEWSAEVWNQPVVSYSYAYADIKTGKAVAKLEDAMVPITAEDPRHAFRARDAKFLVRVAMNLAYGLERSPDASLTDNETRDATGHAAYEYELELNGEGRIVGGEWLVNTHPDFLWIPVKGSHAVSTGDRWLDQNHDRSHWGQGAVVPASWRKAAAYASPQGQPLARVVEQLVQWSNE